MKRILSGFLALLVTISPVNVLAVTNYCNDASVAGCWGMEDSGTENDLSSNNEDLTVSASDTIPQSTDRNFGDFSRDLELGDTEYLMHADGGTTDIHGANQHLSIVFWAKVESLPTSTNLAVFVTKSLTTGNQRGYAVYINSGNSDFVEFQLSHDGTNSTFAQVSVAPTTGVWEHYAVTYNDVVMTIYKNGVNIDDTAKTNGIFSNTAEFRIGASTTNANYLDGLMDDVAVFSRALSEVEINEIMNCGLTGAGCQEGESTVLRSVTARGVTIN